MMKPIRSIFLVLMALLLAAPAWGAITGTGTAGAIEAVRTTGAVSCSMPCSLGDATVPAGPNRIALFYIGMGTSSGWASPGLTVGGTAATVIDSITTTTTNNLIACLTDAQLTSIGTGAQALVATGTASVNTNGISAHTIFLFGAAQTCPPTLSTLDDHASASSAADTLTTTVNGSAFFSFVVTGGDRKSTLAPTSPQTLLINDYGAAAGRTYGSSFEIVATAAETTATWTWTSGSNNNSGAVVIEPAPASDIPQHMW